MVSRVNKANTDFSLTVKTFSPRIKVWLLHLHILCSLLQPHTAYTVYTLCEKYHFPFLIWTSLSLRTCIRRVQYSERALNFGCYVIRSTRWVLCARKWCNIRSQKKSRCIYTFRCVCVQKFILMMNLFKREILCLRYFFVRIYTFLYLYYKSWKDRYIYYTKVCLLRRFLYRSKIGLPCRRHNWLFEMIAYE